MSTHVPGIQSFFSFLHHFVLAKLATSGETLLDLRVTLPEAVLCVTPSLCPCWQKGEV